MGTDTGTGDREGGYMGRKASVRYYESKRAFMCTFEGKRYRLADAPVDDSPSGPRYLAALDRFSEIMRGEGRVDARDTRMCAAVDRWLAHARTHTSPEHHEVSARYLARGVARWGEMPVSNFRPHHVDAWFVGEVTWGSTTKKIAYARLCTALNFNVERGFIRSHGLQGAKPPAACKDRARGAEYVLSDSTVSRILDSAKGRFREYLTALARTGARPGEIARATDAHFRPAIGAVVFKAIDHKTGRKTGKDRVIYLPADVIALVRGRTGLLFPASRGAGYSRSALCHAWRVTLARVLGIDRAHTILYSFRHTWITRALLRGFSIKLIADLQGTSVAMIEKNYGHAMGEEEAMRKVFLEMCQ
jgi:integrase